MHNAIDDGQQANKGASLSIALLAGLSAVVQARKRRYLVYPTQNSPFIVNPFMKAIEAVAYIFNGVLALIALAGLTIVAVHRESSAGMLNFAVTSAWITAAYAVLHSDPRYSIPFRSAEIALACVAVAAFQARVRDLTRGPGDLAR